MAVKDKNIKKDANVARECVVLYLASSAVSQTATEGDEVTPGFAFEIEKVEVYSQTVTATITCDVLIGSTTCLTGAVTPVALTPTAGTLSSTLSAIRGSSTDTIKLVYTSNGSGAATGLRARVWIRPYPMNGEAFSL